MKSLFISLPLLLTTGLLTAQTGKPVTSGKITFEEKVKLQIRLEGDASTFADQLPKERKSEKILTFNNDATLFEDGGSDMQDEMASNHSDGTMNVKIMVGNGENKIYTDLKNKKIIDQRDFMNRMFLVEKPFSGTEWKVTGNQKMILGYNCLEATRQDTSGNKTTAWFTPAISISGGPEGICNLPGMVLEADFNDGSRTYTAKSIDTSEAVKIQKPSDGKKVSEEEYKKIVAEKLKEMGVEQGGEGGNQVRVVIRHQ